MAIATRSAFRIPLANNGMEYLLSCCSLPFIPFVLWTPRMRWACFKISISSRKLGRNRYPARIPYVILGGTLHCCIKLSINFVESVVRANNKDNETKQRERRARLHPVMTLPSVISKPQMVNKTFPYEKV